MTAGKEIRVRGLVQGVGFRPFVYRLAKKHKLKGFVLNDSHGVKIKVIGNAHSIESFIREIKSTPPPLSEITAIEQKRTKILDFADFSIVESEKNSKISTLVSPDIATCDSCLKEIEDRNDRRYLYPFTNCTNCGPRFTIIKKIPYDRTNTTMDDFKMCKDCEKEYKDPNDRRFHAEPIACPNCGPKLKILNSGLNDVNSTDPLGFAIKSLLKGKIVAVKGLGGFHLACSASNKLSVARLRTLKGREEKPLALMVPSLEYAGRLAELSQSEKNVLKSPERPIVLLKRAVSADISKNVSPNNSHLGIMLPYTPLHHLLFTYDHKNRKIRSKGSNFKALVMTSGNISEEPIVINEVEVKKRIRGVFDFMLTHEREIYTRADDSVVRLIFNNNLFIRRSRGFAPSPIYLNKKLKEILAVGAELKNTVCLTKSNNAFLSQHIGDLKNFENYEVFKESINSLKDTLKSDPKIVAFDMHPNYLNSKYALSETFEARIGVQHHHAHMASCMAENGIDEPVIGIILDGTGYGIDGTIWGGEIFQGDFGSFERKAHLRNMPMPGGDSTANETYRMAFSYLYATYGQYWKNLDIPFINRIGRDKLSFLEKMIQTKTNSPMTSSMGRLFDAVTSLVGIKDYNTYEGQAPFMLEMSADCKNKEIYPFTIYKEGKDLIVNTIPMIEAIVSDLKRNNKDQVSSKFHNTIIKSFAKGAKTVSSTSGLKNVVLSGGCFQNIYLLKGMTEELIKNGLKVYSHHKVPSNDGGISLGQAVIADRIVK